jgi:transposase
LVAAASTCIQHIQKALTEMNIQLANVISDISGLTGMAILRAVVSGERNPQALARLKNERIQASREEIAHSLEGNCRQELLFVLEQSLALYDSYQVNIGECNLRIEVHLKSMESKTTAEQQPALNARGNRKQTPCFDLASQLYRIAGVDLTQIDGIQVQTAQTVISEVGVDMSRWKSEKQFASWLGLCPDNRISGG